MVAPALQACLWSPDLTVLEVFMVVTGSCGSSRLYGVQDAETEACPALREMPIQTRGPAGIEQGSGAQLPGRPVLAMSEAWLQTRPAL